MYWFPLFFNKKKYFSYIINLYKTGIRPKREWERLFVMLFSLRTPVIRLLHLSTYPHIPFSLGPIRRLAVEMLNWESAPTWLAENGCCMWWWWRLRTLCCGLFLSCRLLCGWSSRLWLHKSIFFCVFMRLCRHACTYFSQIVFSFSQFLILVGIFHCKKRYTVFFNV